MPVKKRAKKGIKITVKGIKTTPKKKGKSKVLGCLCEISSGTKVPYSK